MIASLRRQLARRERRIPRRLENRPGVERPGPMMAAANMPFGAAGVRPALEECSNAWRSLSGSYGTNGQHSWNGRMWHVGAHANGNLLVPPNSQYPYCQFWDTNSDSDSGGFWGLTSKHPGGANICMADGSVRFLKSSVQ